MANDKQRRAHADEREPVDTTGNPALEARWQALVQEVIDAKKAALDALAACVEAERERGPLDRASSDGIAQVEEAHAAYSAAIERVREAGERMKAGDL